MDPLSASMRIASKGMIAQSSRMRIVAENLANATSTGAAPGADPYTRKTITFESSLDEASGLETVEVAEVGRHSSSYRVVHDPGHPAADASGYVKLPNVDPVVELADMREAHRAYQGNVQMIKSAREAITTLIDLLRSGS